MDLNRGTDGFSMRNLLGTGQFGSAYKGRLHLEDNPVAIKVFKLKLQGGMKSFKTECEAMRNLRHRNLVRVVTSCCTTDLFGNAFKALVFEYMPNGSLEEWLHLKSDGKVLNLSQRITIAADVASALEYLHDQCTTPMVHCDLKPNNILLDQGMTACVSDFGIVRFLASANPKSKNSTSLIGLRGSIGYIPLEYGMGGKASTNKDVYSFGVLLLEMITGKRPTDEMFKEGLSLPKLVHNAFPDTINEIIDPIICISEEEEEDYDSKRIQGYVLQLVKIGLLCTAELPKHRLQMRQVAYEIISIRQELLN